MNIKHTMLVGATVATVAAAGIGGVGLVSADTSSSASTAGSSSLVDKIASKFNLSKTDVQAVFDEDHQAKEAEHEAEQKQALTDAVKAGKLTQAQADHITSALAEIKTLRGDTSPKDVSDTVRDQIKAKMDDLRTWAEDNDVDMQYVMPMRGGHGGGPGGMRGEKPADDSSAATSAN